RLRRLLSQHLGEPAEHLAIDAPVAGVLFELVESLALALRLTPRARLDLRVERVARREDAGGDVERIATRSARIAAAVESLVVRRGEQRVRTQQLGALQDARGLRGVLAHALLLGAEQ